MKTKLSSLTFFQSGIVFSIGLKYILYSSVYLFTFFLLCFEVYILELNSKFVNNFPHFEGYPAAESFKERPGSEAVCRISILFWKIENCLKQFSFQERHETEAGLSKTTSFWRLENCLKQGRFSERPVTGAGQTPDTSVGKLPRSMQFYT